LFKCHLNVLEKITNILKSLFESQNRLITRMQTCSIFFSRKSCFLTSISSVSLNFWMASPVVGAFSPFLPLPNILPRKLIFEYFFCTSVFTKCIWSQVETLILIMSHFVVFISLWRIDSLFYQKEIKGIFFVTQISTFLLILTEVDS